MHETSSHTSHLTPRSLEVEHAAGTLRLLGEPTRLCVIASLARHGESSVGELAERLGRPVPALSQHLAKLRAGRLVLFRREGTTVWYSLASSHVARLATQVLQHSEHLVYDHPPHHHTTDSGATAQE